MTRKEIEEQYKVNENGVITSPGKFEGEMYYAVNYWNMVMNGFNDGAMILENGTLVSIFNYEEDYKDYPELEDVTELKLWEDDNGFIHCQTKGE